MKIKWHMYKAELVIISVKDDFRDVGIDQVMTYEV